MCVVGRDTCARTPDQCAEGTAACSASRAPASSGLFLLPIHLGQRKGGAAREPGARLAKPPDVDPCTTSSSPQLAGGYVLQRRIAAGAYGTVFTAVKAPGLKVAVKVPRSLAAPALVAEAALLRRLSHGNIVRFIELDAIGDRPCLVLEYVSGQTLHQRIVNEGALSVRRTADIALQLLRALEHVHATGVVHLDIKPSNVVLGRNARATLIDFGSAWCATGASPAFVAMTGTPSYTAPELLAGTPPPRPACDLYALGLLLVECLTGRRLMRGSPDEIVEQHLSHQRHHLSEVVRESPLARVLARAIDKDPQRRFQSATAMARQLQSAACSAAIWPSHADVA